MGQHVDLLDCTHEFLRRSGQLIGGSDHDERHRWISEEWAEYLEAVHEDDEAGQVDALLDLIVVAWGTLVQRYGSYWARLFAAEVARSNLDKIENGVHRSDDGRVLKPEGWVPPRIAELLSISRSGADT